MFIIIIIIIICSSSSSRRSSCSSSIYTFLVVFLSPDYTSYGFIFIYRSVRSKRKRKLLQQIFFLNLKKKNVFFSF